jgi:integrase
LFQKPSLQCTNFHRHAIDDERILIGICEYQHIMSLAGLPAIRFHDLRHTSLSILLESGTPVNTVQKRAGHSKASVTVDVYGHAMAHSQEEAAQKIQEMVAPIPVELK